MKAKSIETKNATIIHFHISSPYIPWNVYETLSTWKMEHPVLDYRIYTTETEALFVKSYYKEFYNIYNKINDASYQSKLAQFLILYTFGGVSVDGLQSIDFSLDRFLSLHKASLVIIENRKNCTGVDCQASCHSNLFATKLLVAERGHPLVYHYLQRIKYALSENEQMNTALITPWFDGTRWSEVVFEYFFTEYNLGPDDIFRRSSSFQAIRKSEFYICNEEVLFTQGSCLQMTNTSVVDNEIGCHYTETHYDKSMFKNLEALNVVPLDYWWIPNDEMDELSSIWFITRNNSIANRQYRQKRARIQIEQEGLKVHLKLISIPEDTFSMREWMSQENLLRKRYQDKVAASCRAQMEEIEAKIEASQSLEKQNPSKQVHTHSQETRHVESKRLKQEPNTVSYKGSLVLFLKIIIFLLRNKQ